MLLLFFFDVVELFLFMFLGRLMVCFFIDDNLLKLKFYVVCFK